MRSMTGYGDATARGDEQRVTVTARSVNHRNRDVVVRVRSPLRAMERELRLVVAEEVRRGRVEVAVESEPVGVSADLGLDDRTAMALQQAVRRWRRHGLVAEDLGAGELLSAALGFRSCPVRAEAIEEERSLAMSACRQAVASLAAEREREGKVLEAALRGQVTALRACTAELAARRREVVDQAPSELARRVGELLAEQPVNQAPAASNVVDPARLVQEVALIVERTDIAEELDRLEGHLDGFEAALGETGAVGRRLDFLSQELLRELNTVGAKCRDLQMQRAVVEGKLLCEQMREQAQNVE